MRTGPDRDLDLIIFGMPDHEDEFVGAQQALVNIT
jgi:hypothetical protein